MPTSLKRVVTVVIGLSEQFCDVDKSIKRRLMGRKGERRGRERREEQNEGRKERKGKERSRERKEKGEVRQGEKKRRKGERREKERRMGRVSRTLRTFNLHPTISPSDCETF